jgi:phenylacetate-CoA ligase
VLPAAVLDDERIGRFAIELGNRKLALLRGFSTPLYLVAQYLLRNRDLRCGVPAVISTGEPLFGHMRDTIETAFDARVFDSYGAREVALIAQECPAHTGMHINAESVIVETAGPPVDGKYRLLITDLFNYGMPFLRYEIGDMGAIMNNTCSCGRGLPLMEMGVGREADIMYTPDGRVVPAVTMVLYLVDNGPAVGQVQVEQDAIDHLIVRLTKDPPPDDCLFGFYRKEIAKLFGEKMTVTFEVVDTIANESSGKYKFARCTIPPRDIPSRYRV